MHSEPIKLVQSAFAAIALTCAMVCSTVGAAPPSPQSKILTYKAYAKIDHEVPYVLEFKAGKGALLIYGAEHVFDWMAPQIEDIQIEWKRFKPTIAYNEGGNPPSEPSVETAVQRWGEAGLTRYLAAENRVPVATFEPLRSYNIDGLLKRYSAEQVKTFMALRGFLTFRRSKRDETPDAYMTKVLGEANTIAGSPSNITELGVVYARLFPGQTDWHTVADEWFDPTQSIHYTNDLQNDDALIRDQHIFKVLVDRVRRGDRVIAIIGASHVPVLEPALIAALGNSIRKRNGESKP